MGTLEVTYPNGRVVLMAGDDIEAAKRDTGSDFIKALSDDDITKMQVAAARERIAEGYPERDYAAIFLAAGVAPGDETETDEPSMSWSKAKLADYLTEHGGEVEDGDTKADILAAIEGLP